MILREKKSEDKPNKQRDASCIPFLIAFLNLVEGGSKMMRFCSNVSRRRMLIRRAVQLGERSPFFIRQRRKEKREVHLHFPQYFLLMQALQSI